MKTPWARKNSKRPPRLATTRPTAIITAPNTTVQRTPTRSAARPIAIPPTDEPSQASA